MNRPVGGRPGRPGAGNGGGSNPGRPNPSRPRPPGPSRPQPSKPVHRPSRPNRPRPPIGGHRPGHRYPIGAYRRPGGYFFQRWAVGATLPGLFMAQSYWLSTPDSYGLRPAPIGTRWVRVDDDALLVSNSTGRVIEVVHNIFY
ncbi:RcnB family protein [Caulobacter sp. S45]|uniref:RcnB family protein n=1 Tax=Caulobacter sp. S45 TaxID=1641861 RepID=UPI00131E93B3|nr:RcnB family protein [Caulobacter sp. S45]